MTFKQVILIAAMLCTIYVKCDDKEQCKLDNDECVTLAAIQVYPDIVAGGPGVETSDPLTRHVVNVDTPEMSYNLQDAKLTGLRDCKVFSMKFNLTDESLRYGILVPKLVILGDYRVEGLMNDISVSGKGKCKSTYTDYEIIFHDKYAKNYDDKDERHHQLFNFTLEMKVKGNKKYEYAGLKFGQEGDVSEKNLQEFDGIIHELVMYSFMQKHIDNINDFLKIVSINDILSKV